MKFADSHLPTVLIPFARGVWLCHESLHGFELRPVSRLHGGIGTAGISRRYLNDGKYRTCQRRHPAPDFCYDLLRLVLVTEWWIISSHEPTWHTALAE